MNTKAGNPLPMVFLIVFLDIMGFSVLFPIIPQLLDYYLALESIDRGFLMRLMEFLSALSMQASGSMGHVVVLFGGLLGSLYSLLQFTCAPLLGALSDRMGRKPVLILTLCGTCFSYLLWFFAGNFPLFLLSRFIAGTMSANISIASAVVADVTDLKSRSKGMAVVGIAIGMGFTLGPALGGFFSQIPLTAYFASGSDGSIGITPFSAVAAVALFLSLINLIQVTFFFRETLVNSEQHSQSHRTTEITKIFARLSYPGVSLANLAFFLFTLAFSGMEFTLVFLAVERFQYSPVDNAWMFVFVGVLIILTQGGYFRRKVEKVGEKTMALRGLAFQIPGLVFIGAAHQPFLLYTGLAFLAIGSALINPALSGLVSLYAPNHEQGKVMGIFRSAGALARGIGPLLCALLYWQLGALWAYILAAAFMIWPLLLVRKLPKPAPQK